jgi:O-antigen biosynthesis protein
MGIAGTACQVFQIWAPGRLQLSCMREFFNKIRASFVSTATARAQELDSKLILDSGLFDQAYYVQKYGGYIAPTGLDPVLHYLRIGGLNGFNPSTEFDSAMYLLEYPEVRKAKFNPLLHYIRHGRYEGRAIYPVIEDAPAPIAPTEQQWQALADAQAGLESAEPVVDVIVPVFRGYDETAHCLYTAIGSRLHCALPFEVVAVNDGSPVAEIKALLDDLSRRKLITLLRHESNLGFVRSVNSGMKRNVERDVVLLNSDTAVYGDWLDRLHRAAYSGENVGTVTPFSNNATICSYPNFPGQFKGSFEVAFEEMDQIANAANRGKTVEVPTAVGFCMYIRRKCLQQFGYFDEEAFGLGYGEENDFSLRIRQHGWRNLLAGDVFVRHLGRVSFLDSAERRVEEGLKVINKRFPHYLPSIAEYVKQDPPKALRRGIDVARLKRAIGGRAVLFTFHSLGGGTARHVQELSELLMREGVGVLWLQPVIGDRSRAVLRHPAVKHLSSAVTFDLSRQLAELAEIVQSLGIRHIHVQHTLGFASDFTTWIQDLASLCNLAYDVTIHDYFLACPRITMIDQSGRYCANVDVEKCDACIAALGSEVGRVRAADWRENSTKFLSSARSIFVPDASVQHYIQPFFPSLQFLTRPHPETVPERMVEPVPLQPDENLRVAVIGAIGTHKGSDLLKLCAQDAADRRLPIEFHLFGYSNHLELKTLPNIKLTGRYSEKELPGLLNEGRCHLAFFPAVWPETYSYTLSQAWFAGLYPVAFDLGAIANRIRRGGWGRILPLDMAGDPAGVNDSLLALTPLPPAPGDFDPVLGARQYRTIWSDYYQFG